MRLLNAFEASALSVSATIFDTLCEVDSKFVKIADKECDAVSSEVKKWFKKLAVSTVICMGEYCFTIGQPTERRACIR